MARGPIKAAGQNSRISKHWIESLVIQWFQRFKVKYQHCDWPTHQLLT